MDKRELWIDTRGEPVITTTSKGHGNAVYWGWTPAKAVPQLTYLQRKALRRLGRGKSISNSMSEDPVISKCFERENIEMPVHLNVVEWCDWEARVRSTQPTLTEYGKFLLASIGEDV